MIANKKPGKAGWLAAISLIMAPATLAQDATRQSDPADDQPLPDELAERADLQKLLASAIAALPPTYGEVVALRYAGDRSFAEIAEILDCDEGAARVRFHRAKGLLRHQLRVLLEANP